MKSYKAKDAIILDVTYKRDGTIRTLAQLKTKPELGRCWMMVEKWKIIVACCMLLLAFTILIAAIAVVSIAQRPAFYLENCAQRSCLKGLNLKCINKTCVCLDNQFYSSSCENKREYLEHCSVSLPCKDNVSLMCLDGVCKCNRTMYWKSTGKCDFKKNYKQTCSSDVECLSDLALYCDKTTAKCLCDTNTRYWDDSACTLRRGYNETCTKTSECLPDSLLECINGTCLCVSSTQYYESTYSRCLNILYEFESCGITRQCYTPMTCVSGTCRCPLNQYHDINTLTCVDQTLVNTTCNVTHTCRTDLGLECKGGYCVCVSSLPYWSTFHTKCILQKTYSQTTCYDATDCDTSNGQICNVDATYISTPCSCPSTSTIGMCDCTRVSGNENYWDSTMCVPALSNGQACSGSSSSYMCQTVTQGTICNSSSGNFICECPPLKYFDGTQCSDQVIVNMACPLGIECRADYGLICQSGTCVCNDTYQFWSTSVTPNRCINYRTYTQSCISNGDCDSKLGLICYSSSNSACNCPTTSTINQCDCTRENNNETYWNGTACVAAGTFNAVCTVGKNYICQTITQNTTCVGSVCVCGTNGGLQSTTNRCAYCDTGYTYLLDICYMVSTLTTSNTDPNGVGPKVDSGCARTGAETASVINATVENFLTSKQVNSREYWVDGYLVSGTTYASRDGTITYTNWCSGFPNGKALVYWLAGSNCYGTDDNTGGVTKYYFCKYTP